MLLAVAAGQPSFAGSLLRVPLGCMALGTCWDQRQYVLEDATSTNDVVVPTVGTVSVKQGDSALMPVLPPDNEALTDLKAEALKAAEAAPTFSDEQRAELQRYPGKPYGFPPPDVARELQEGLGSTQTELCSGSYLLMRALAGHATVAKSDEDRFSAIYQLYLSSCFAPLERYDDVLSRLVFLYSDFQSATPVVYCTGFILRDNYVITAKHCLVEEASLEDFDANWGQADRDHRITNVNLRPRTMALTLAAAPFSFPVEVGEAKFNPDMSFNPNLPGTDTVILRLPELSSTLPPYRTGAPMQWDKAIFFGQFLDLGVLLPLATEGDANALRTALRSMIKVDDSQSCRIFVLQNGCEFHSCQTFEGFSGTPFFDQKEGELRLVGVHSGATGYTNPVCDMKRATFYPNYAVDITRAAGVRALVGSETSN